MEHDEYDGVEVTGDRQLDEQGFESPKRGPAGQRPTMTGVARMVARQRQRREEQRQRRDERRG
jgi:hypothetical protein